MIVGLLTVELFLGDIFTLKDKRSIVKSTIKRIQNRYNVSIAETERQDEKRWAVIGMACVSNTTRHIDQQLDEILNFMENDGRYSLANISKEIL